MNSLFKQVFPYSVNALNNGTMMKFVPVAGVKDFVVPSYKDLQMPDDEGKRRLRFVEKTPVVPGGIPVPRRMKSLHLIRGEEHVHVDLRHKQYGIIALRGGFLTHGHMEMIRMGIFRIIDTRTMFAIWRIENPWFPRTKKGQGQRMGGGKGAISYFTTPVKAKRVLMEVGGRCTFGEVEPMLNRVVGKLPFPAKVVSHKMLLEMREEEERIENENINPYTFKYLVQNNMLGINVWIKKKLDKKYYGKYT